jgi:transglutaminase-like putative cysteine protease
MKFSAYFTLISYLMAGTGLVAASLTNAISPVFLVGVGALTFLSFFLNLQGKTINISRFIWNSIAAVILAAGLIDYLLISQSLIDTSVRFLTLLMVAKLFDLKTSRDYAALYLLTFFQLLAAAASTVNLSFLFALALYILTGIWALTLFNLKKEWEERSAPHKEMAKNILGPYFFIVTAGLAVLSLIITLSLFFVIPRMGVGFFPKQTPDTLKISGFSEKIDMGELGPVKLDPAIVMRVKLQPPLPPPLLKGGLGGLYFRGISFDTYNGTQWLQTLNKMMPLKKTQDGVWRLADSISWSEAGSAILTQTILLEPIETNVLFAAWDGAGVSGNFRNVVTDTMGAFYLPTASYSRIEYTAYSLLPASPPPPVPLWGQISNLSPEKGNKGGGKQDYREEVPLQYLQLPDGLERVSDLAIKITSDKKTPLDKATAIEQYLKRNYRYTLNPGIPDRSTRGQEGIGKNPVEDFLFSTKEGYCEQYANAMAVMLRTIGIPSRLVTGFLPGEWNKFGNYLIIRKRDAHSWVEAYMPDAGWVIFDSTPSAEAVGEMPAATSLITLYIDSLKWRWNRYIVNYSFQDQLNFAKAIENKGRSALSKLRWSFNIKSVHYTWKDMLIFVTAAVITAIILIITTRIVWKPKDMAKWPNAPFFYKDMLRLLAQKGRIKKPGETALEFADAADMEEVKAITDIYYNIRFGGHKATDEEQSIISVYLKAIKNYKQQVI